MTSESANPYRPPGDNPPGGSSRDWVARIRGLKTIAALTVVICIIGSTFGTVLGMMRSFDVIATGAQPISPAELSGSINRSLTTGIRTAEVTAEKLADRAKQQQTAGAAHLGVPVEVTNSIGIKLVFIPAGEFLMGSPDSDSSADDEKPQHTVRLTKPFYLGVTEVTQEQYERVMGSNPSHFKGAQLPVENVSWNDAMEFCRKLSELPAERSVGRVAIHGGRNASHA